MNNFAQLISVAQLNCTPALASNTSKNKQASAEPFASLLNAADTIKAMANNRSDIPGTHVVASISANVNAEQPSVTGTSVIATTDTADSSNTYLQASQIIVPTSVNHITRGDSLSIDVNSQNKLTLTYGGFTQGRSISTGAAGDSGTAVPANNPFAGNILDADNASQSFLGITGSSQFTLKDLQFSIKSPTSGTETFTYVPIFPNAALGQFNNLNNLADAINNTGNGLTARVSDGRLYLGSTNANDPVTITNGGKDIDWKNELGIANVSAGTNRFSSLQSLNDDINTKQDLSATVWNPLGDSSLQISTKTVLDTLKIKDSASNSGSLVSEFGLAPSLDGGSFTPQTTGLIPAAYSPTVAGKNMASGAIAPNYMRPITMQDSLGGFKTVDVGMIKIKDNTWAVEIYGGDAKTSNPNVPINYGTVTFGADGRVSQVSASLQQPVNLHWSDGATTSFALDLTGQKGAFGTATQGLTQRDAPYTVYSDDVRDV